MSAAAALELDLPRPPVLDANQIRMIETLERERSRRACRRSLLEYARRMLPSYRFGWFHDELARTLEVFMRDVEEGRRPRLMIFAPPQHGKSTIVSRAFPAWLLGAHPDWAVVTASYGAELIAGHARWTRNALESPEHLDVFPSSRLAKDQSQKADFATTSGGGLRARGVGGGLTGFPARVLIIDDPIKGQKEARSHAIRRETMEWFHQIAKARLAPGGGILIMMTRWNVGDTAGELLREAERVKDADQWKVVSFPAIAALDETHRRSGEALHPERYPLHELEAIKRNMPADAWAALYQQSPVQDGGNIFRQEWWKFIAPADIPTTGYIVQSWDTAFKDKPESDTSSCITARIAPSGIYILDVYSGRVEFPDLKSMAVQLAARFRPSFVYIEDKASGQSLIQELRRSSTLPIHPVKVDRDKILRANAATPLVRDGKVYLPEGASWIESFLEVMTSFPAHPNKDVVDAFTQMIQEIAWVGYDETAEDTRSSLVGGMPRALRDAEEKPAPDSILASEEFAW